MEIVLSKNKEIVVPEKTMDRYLVSSIQIQADVEGNTNATVTLIPFISGTKELSPYPEHVRKLVYDDITKGPLAEAIQGVVAALQAEEG